MRTGRQRWVGLVTVLLGLLGAATGTVGRAEAGDVLVFAAASLKNALDEVAADWRRGTGRRVTISYGASNTLAKQIEQGAPADLFVSADLEWMDWAQGKGLIRPETRRNLLGNGLVLVGPKDSVRAIEIRPGLDLRAALGGGRLALANVEAVPAGKYAKAALSKLGAWEGVKDRTAQAESVRAALLLVVRGEAPLGIVYRSDALAEPGVVVAATFPKEAHPPIVYPAALTTASKQPEAAAFLAHLASPAARAVFERHGFEALGTTSSGS